MSDRQKLIMLVIIVSVVLFFVYAAGCAVWFASKTRTVFERTSILTYRSLGIRGFNKLLLRDVAITMPVPITLDLDEVVIKSNRFLFAREANYQVVINVKRGAMVFGTPEEDFEGYRDARFTVAPFEIVLDVRGKSIDVKDGAIMVENAAQLMYDVSYALKYFSLFITLKLDPALLANARDARYFKNAFDRASDNTTMTMSVQGELPLLRVEIKAPLMAFDFAYSLERG